MNTYFKLLGCVLATCFTALILVGMGVGIRNMLTYKENYPNIHGNESLECSPATFRGKDGIACDNAKFYVYY